MSSGGRRIPTSSFRRGSRVEYSVLLGNERRRIPGTIAYGPGSFHLKPNENDWCGVVLDEPYGKNNGTIQGKKYFECEENHGVIVRVSTLRPYSESGVGGHSRIPLPRSTGGTGSSKSSTPSTTPKSMTPSSSIQSFTGMFDSGGDASSSGQQSVKSKLTESINIPTTHVSKIRPPTQLMSSSTQEIGSKFPTVQTSTTTGQSNIRQMVEKIEIKRDEMMRDDDAAQDISQTVESSQSSTPTHKSSKEYQEMQEKVKDLESKLSTLMHKRAEDRQKFKEFERIKIQYEQLMENKKQMAEKIAELSRQKAQAEKEAQEAREEQVRQAEEIKDLVDNAELAVIDKEMAENKAEQLQIELEECREQLEEAKLDFEILKTEIEDKGVDGAASSFQLKKLEEQNVRYKEALLKLRDISTADRSTIQVLQKDMERKNEEINNLMQTNDKYKAELDKCHEQIEELKEQVDMALGSQEMVEKLTEKNLAMEDKVEELQKALDEEEKIKDLSNMIIEEKDDIIADLREEVDRYKTNLVNLRNSFLVSQETIQDHEQTIKKFRELVAMLKEENQMLRQTQEQDLTKVQQAVDVQKQLENIEFKTRLLDRKDTSRAIDMELRQLDIDQCYRHMVFLARFFPESFFFRGGDHDAIAVLLYIPRIFSKCHIIERQVLDKFSSSGQQQQASTPESIIREAFDDQTNQLSVDRSDRLKQQIFTKHIVYLLTSIRSTLDKYQDILTKCDADLFMKLGSLYPELSTHEKSIDHFVDLLREDKLDETVSLDSLEKILSYLQSLYNIHIVGSTVSSDSNRPVVVASENHNKFLNDLLDVLRTGTEASILDVKIISRMSQTQAAMSISSMETSLIDIEQFGKKIRRRMVSAGSGSSDLNPACLVRFPSIVEAELLDSFHNFSLIVRQLKTIRQVLITQFITQQQSKNEDTENEDNQNKLSTNAQLFTLDDLEKACKEWTGNSLKSLMEMLNNVMSSICKFCTILQQGDYDISKSEATDSSHQPSIQQQQNLVSLPPSFQSMFSSRSGSSGPISGPGSISSQNSLNCVPLDQRAQIWRAQSEQINDFRQKIHSQESDINELKRALKAKIDEVSEIQIRRDLTEKKHKEALKEQQKLQDEVERLRKALQEKEAECERTLTKYNQEINDLYSDQRMMKEKLKDFSKNALLGKMLLSTPGGSPNAASLSTGSPITSLAGGPNLTSASPISMGNISLSSLHQQSISLSPNSSLNHSLITSATVHLGAGQSSATPVISNDVLELQQQIHNLRLAMKRLAARNTELKSMLASHEERIQLAEDGQILKVRPQWYLDALRRQQQHPRLMDDRICHSILEPKFQEFRQKLLQLKQDFMAHRCDSSMWLPDLEKIQNREKPGWSRCIGDLIRRQQQQQNLTELSLDIRYKQLCEEFGQFVRSLDDGFSCDSTFVSFIAPHVNKVISSRPELVARIKVNCSQEENDTKIIPLEVSMGELQRIQTMLLSC